MPAYLLTGVGGASLPPWRHTPMNTNPERLTVGIYYTGDMANVSDCGTITKNDSPTASWRKRGYQADDGREIRALSTLHFQPGPGRRFWTANKGDAEHEASIKAFAWGFSQFRSVRVAQIGN